MPLTLTDAQARELRKRADQLQASLRMLKDHVESICWRAEQLAAVCTDYDFCTRAIEPLEPKPRAPRRKK